MLAAIREIVGPAEIALSVVSVMELEHGIWRAKEPARTRLRRQFLEDLIGNVPVYPITTELGRKAGRLDAEQQARTPPFVILLSPSPCSMESLETAATLAAGSIDKRVSPVRSSAQTY